MSDNTNPPTDVPSAVREQLRALVDAVLPEIIGAANVSLTVDHRGGSALIAATDRDAEALAAIECGTDGPTLATLRTGRISRLPNTARARTWPEYAHACQRHGIYSVTSFPVSVAGERVGALTIASTDRFGFGKDETRIGIETAARAAHILDAAR